MNDDCIHYIYEKDTGFAYCKIDLTDCKNCKEFYSETDAKDDAKNFGNDRY